MTNTCYRQDQVRELICNSNFIISSKHPVLSIILEEKVDNTLISSEFDKCHTKGFGKTSGGGGVEFSKEHVCRP